MTQLPAVAPVPAYKRDPHLPSPEVCDWLLSLEWSKPSTVKVIADDGSSEIYDCCIARPALGRDEMIDLALPADGIKMLQAEALVRQKQVELAGKKRENAALALKLEGTYGKTVEY
jgi:hypothetical protein